MGFAASVAGSCQHRQQFFIVLQSGADGILIPHLQQAMLVGCNRFKTLHNSKSETILTTTIKTK